MPAAASATTLQQRPAYLDQPSRVVLPVGYSPRRSYPVFIPLPPTGSSSLNMARSLGLDPERQTQFILLLPPGRPQRTEYLPDFISFVQWYEERLLEDLARLFEMHSADRARVYLGGYSLGGDLSWALAARNPDRIAGAVMAGTRASYPVSASTLERMHQTGFRGALLIGASEETGRYNGINSVRSRLEQAAVTHTYTEYRGGHTMPPRTVLQEQVAFVTGVRVATPPQMVPASQATGRPLTGHLTRPTQDRVALRVGVVNITDGAWWPGRHSEAQLRVEWPWSRFYFHSYTGYTATPVSTGLRLRALQQELVFGVGPPGTTTRSGGFSAAGVGWDWIHRLDDGAAPGRIHLVYVRGDRNLAFVPQGWHGADRVDSLLSLRYTLPIGSNLLPQEILNLRAHYLLRLGTRVVIDAAAGAYTLPNLPMQADADGSTGVDHRLEWEAGLGLRVPNPFLWRISYRGTAARALPDGAFHHTSSWRLSVEYSF
ncbi:MAG: alpha/beta fold hydrolase [Spirochaetaceae bacterium]|nr:MAG: alpha/beta fold hydrolase [Spirochaetaceae bacterium]